jgi:hypothetical protein
MQSLCLLALINICLFNKITNWDHVCSLKLIPIFVVCKISSRLHFNQENTLTHKI